MRTTDYKIMLATDLHQIATEAQRKQQGELRNRALKFLSDFQFNQKVNAAAQQGKFALDELIPCDDDKLRIEVMKILVENDYCVNVNFMENGTKLGISVKWPKATKPQIRSSNRINASSTSNSPL